MTPVPCDSESPRVGPVTPTDDRTLRAPCGATSGPIYLRERAQVTLEDRAGDPSPPGRGRRRRESAAMSGLAPRRRPAQRERERERERRVSDADASYRERPSGTRTLQYVHPQRLHAKTTLSRLRPGPSPKGPPKTFAVDHGANPKPDLISTHTPSGAPGHGYFIPDPYSCVKSSWERNTFPLSSPQTVRNRGCRWPRGADSSRQTRSPTCCATPRDLQPRASRVPELRARVLDTRRKTQMPGRSCRCR
jgi:hypothetical protein